MLLGREGAALLQRQIEVLSGPKAAGRFRRRPAVKAALPGGTSAFPSKPGVALPVVDPKQVLGALQAKYLD